jgi:hypothetical protein
MGLTKDVKEVETDLRELDEIINAMVIILFNKGVRTKGRDEESLAGLTLKAHRIVVKLINDENNAKKLILSVEKLLLS